MKRLKIFPKTFIYTLGTMLFVMLIAHLLLYLLAPKMALGFAASESIDNNGILISTNIDSLQFVTKTIRMALPISIFLCTLLSIVCSFLFSRGMTKSIRQLSQTTKRMAQMHIESVCEVKSRDEIGELGENINQLYHSLLSTINSLETEKQRVSDSERSKIEFLRAASHELKTPVTALSATLENMILGVGKYRDYGTYLPECKEMVDQLSAMIQEILETSKMNTTIQTELPAETDLRELLLTLCEPYQLIAATHGIPFLMELKQDTIVKIPVREFSKAVSNILANAVTYTEAGKTVSVTLSENKLVIKNQCTPIAKDEIHRLFEPFYRPDFSRSRSCGGNGLGLYIVDTIFTSLGISYSFVPIEDPRGMQFTVWLP